MKKVIFFYKKIFVFILSIIISASFVFSTVNFSIAKASLPASYDLRSYGYVTSVKNQGAANTCWIFASIGAIESSLIVGGYADSSIDLSEAHLGWFSMNSEISDTNDLTYGDGFSVDNPYQYGGNDLFVTWAIARGFGLELEKYAEYNINTINNSFIRDNERYVSEFNVTEVNIFEKNEINSIKNAILSNGALMASYMDDPSCYNKGKDGYSFYEDHYTSTNHATLIVGWDDDYSKSNFGDSKPENDGAWLCRNTRGSLWGDEGYFWLSYETMALKRIVSFKAEPSEKDIYQIYQYDGYGFSKSLSIKNPGVVYTSNIFDITENGVLKKIAFYTAAPDLEHEITVYLLNSNYSSPIDGKSLCSFKYSTSTLGYYLCDLPKTVKVKEGDTLSIVIKISGEGNIKFYSEGTTDRTSISGKSFVSPDLKEWLDTVDNKYGNLCIKAWVDPDVYEGPDLQNIYDLMNPVLNEYKEDSKLVSAITEASYLLKNGGSDRKILNNYLRLACLYEKYYGYVTIENEEQFLAFAELVNSGKKFYDTLIVLNSDLDFTNTDFEAPSDFHGIFNGKNHLIKGINITTTSDIGLFGTISPSGLVKNVIILNCVFNSNSYAGGIAARNEGTITDCSVCGSFYSEYMYAGGIAGYNEGSIINCVAKVSLNKQSGSICGNNTYGTISNCISENSDFIYIGSDVKDSFFSYLNDNYIIIKGINIPLDIISRYAALYNIKATYSDGYAYSGLKLGNKMFILIGDIDDDGILASSDYLRIKSYFLELLDLSDYQLIAADIDNNGRIEATDYLLIKSHFLKLTNIYGSMQ